MKGRLLALSWAMPPLVYPRSVQISRILKALTERGWESSVVTLAPDADPNGLQDRQLAELYADSYELLPVDTRESVTRSPLWLRAWRRLRRVDDVATDNWARRAGRVLRRETSSRQYDVLLTFAQPWIDHVIGLRIKRRNRALPWVAHFSDPWVDNPYVRYSGEDQAARARKHEHDVIRAADAVIFVTRQTADLVMSKYPKAWRSKAAVVGHGYDEDVLRHVRSGEKPSGRFRIVHTGSLYGGRGPQAILQALSAIAQDPEVRKVLDVEFVGYVGSEWVAMTKDHGLQDFVRFRGKCLYVESLEAALAADLLLLIDAPATLSLFLPSKIVDYMMLRRPILGLTPASGASADVLRSLGYPVVSPDDVDGIATALRVAIDNWRRGEPAGPLPDEARTAAFDVRQAALDFDRTLERAISAAGARG